MRWVRRKSVLAAAAAVVAAALAACLTLVFSSSTPVRPLAHKVAAPAPPPPRPKPKPKPKPCVVGRLSPFTGEPIKSAGPVLAVKIDNIVYARPQTGLT
ncbi:MAG TPA: hypothetical protein VK823_07195, partial [Streptosporangiaceae bacterium]|nr:hypothetical protein [Streptosporangiaceae bacterium]